MVDITMCAGTGCPFEQVCYRSIAEPNRERQSYFKIVPWNEKECAYFWPIGDSAEPVVAIHERN